MAKQKTAEPEQPAKKARQSLDGNYPGLDTISWGIGYLEQFLAIVSEPLLIAATVIATIDFLTGSALLSIPMLNYAWASTLGLAISACFISTWRKAFRALSYNYYGSFGALAGLGLILGIADWTAIDVQSLQQAIHTSLSQSLALLNLNVVFITHIRAAVAISMSVVVAISNHSAISNAQAPKRRLTFVSNLLNKYAPVVSDEQQPAHPNQEVEHLPAQPAEDGERSAPAQTKRQSALQIVSNPLERVKDIVSDNPTISDRKLGKAVGVAAATAKKYREQLTSEQSTAMRNAY